MHLNLLINLESQKINQLNEILIFSHPIKAFLNRRVVYSRLVSPSIKVSPSSLSNYNLSHSPIPASVLNGMNFLQTEFPLQVLLFSPSSCLLQRNKVNTCGNNNFRMLLELLRWNGKLLPSQEIAGIKFGQRFHLNHNNTFQSLVTDPARKTFYRFLSLSRRISERMARRFDDQVPFVCLGNCQG